MMGVGVYFSTRQGWGGTPVLEAGVWYAEVKPQLVRSKNDWPNE